MRVSLLRKWLNLSFAFLCVSATDNLSIHSQWLLRINTELSLCGIFTSSYMSKQMCMCACINALVKTMLVYFLRKAYGLNTSSEFVRWELMQ